MALFVNDEGDRVIRLGMPAHAATYRFKLRPGERITVPRDAVVALVESTSPAKETATPWVWYLKGHGKERYSFRDLGKLAGFVLFVPEDLAAGDELMVLWKDDHCAAARRATQDETEASGPAIEP